jgi:proline iminopeptidase
MAHFVPNRCHFPTWLANFTNWACSSRASPVDSRSLSDFVNCSLSIDVRTTMSLKGILALFVFVLLVCPAFGQVSRSPGKHTVTLNGVRLWYEVAGVGRTGVAPMLYLAGGPGYNSYSFEKTIGSQLERHVQMIYFDERGTGRSERPLNKDYKMSSLVQDVEALRQHLGVQQLSLMGQSFGGTIALEYAARYPENVQKLIIVDGAADLPELFDHWQQEIQDRYPAAWGAAMASEHGHTFKKATAGNDACAVTQARFQVEMDALAKVDSPEFHHWQQFHNQKFRKEQDALDARSGLKNTGELSQAYFSPGSPFLCYRFTANDRLTVPVLIIGGKYDGAVDFKQLQALAQHLRHAELDEFEHSAHFPYAEEPAKFERDVAAFVKDPRLPKP